MTAQEVLAEVRSLGIEVRAAGETLKVSAPKGTLTHEIREKLTQAKPAILAALQVPAVATFWPVEDSWLWIEERSAIMEIDDGMDRERADLRAFELWFHRFVGGTTPAR